MEKHTFSLKVKSELINNSNSFNLSEILGLFFLNKNITEENIIFYTEHSIVCKYITELLTKNFNLKVSYAEKVLANKKLYIITIYNKEDISKIINLLDKSCVIESNYSKTAFLKGVFISYGTIANPKNGYHLEFVVYDKLLAKNLVVFLNSLKNISLNSKMIKRRNNYIVYIKDSEEIINFLTFIGASSCAMDFIQIKMLKELRNQVNRTTNFETANISKIAKVSAIQIEKINELKNTVGLNNLPDDLKKLAFFRLENPEMSLKDLGESMSPKLSRSGVYHRMQRLINYKK